MLINKTPVENDSANSGNHLSDDVRIDNNADWTQHENRELSIKKLLTALLTF